MSDTQEFGIEINLTGADSAIAETKEVGNEFKNLQDTVQNSMKGAQSSVTEFKGAMGELGKEVPVVSGAMKVFNMIVEANPIMFMVTALIALIGILKQSREVTEAFEIAFKVLGVAIRQIADFLVDFGKKVIDAYIHPIETAKKAAAEFVEFMKHPIDSIKKLAEEAKEAGKHAIETMRAAKEAAEAEATLALRNAQINNKIGQERIHQEELLKIARDRAADPAEREKAQKAALEIEKTIGNEQIAIARNIYNTKLATYMLAKQHSPEEVAAMTEAANEFNKVKLDVQTTLDNMGNRVDMLNKKVEQSGIKAENQIKKRNEEALKETAAFNEKLRQLADKEDERIAKDDNTREQLKLKHQQDDELRKQQAAITALDNKKKRTKAEDAELLAMRKVYNATVVAQAKDTAKLIADQETEAKKKQADKDLKDIEAKQKEELLFTKNNLDEILADEKSTLAQKTDANNKYYAQLLKNDKLTVQERRKITNDQVKADKKIIDDDVKRAKNAEEEKLAAKKKSVKEGFDDAKEAMAALSALDDLADELASNRLKKGQELSVQQQKSEFNRKKELGLLTAGINIAEGIVKAVSESPDTGGLPGTAFVAALGAIQLAAIAAKKFTPDAGSGGGGGGSAYGAGGIAQGNSHANGGIKTNVGEIEGGEAIINKISTSAFAPVLSAINKAGGGKDFAPASTSKSNTGSSSRSQVPIKAQVVTTEITNKQQAHAKNQQSARLRQ